MAAAMRLVVILLFYGLFGGQHYIPVAVSKSVKVVYFYKSEASFVPLNVSIFLNIVNNYWDMCIFDN